MSVPVRRTSTLAIRRAQLPHLLRTVPATMPWRIVGGGTATAVALVPLIHAMHGDGATRAGMQAAGFVLACSAGVAARDDASSTLAPSPTPLRVRAALRVLSVLGLIAVVWLGLAAYVAVVASVAGLEVWSLHLAAITLVVLAVTLHLGEVAAVPAVLLTLIGTYRMPPRWGMYVDPGATGFAAAQVRWTALLVVAAAVAALALRDPSTGRRTGLGRSVRAARLRRESAAP